MRVCVPAYRDNDPVSSPPHDFRAYAHRGGAREAAENSLTAFRHAASLGFTFLETDVRPTRDGVALLHHDARLERTTNATGLVRDATWSQLRTVRLPDANPPLRLEELLEELPEAHVTVDAKEDGSVTAIADAVRRARAMDRVCIASFSRRRLTRLRSLLPRVESAAHPWEVARLRYLPPTSLPRVSRIQLPPRAFGIALATTQVLATARTRGLAVDVWTIDAPEDMAALIGIGVNGIMTDSPSVLARVLSDR